MEIHEITDGDVLVLAPDGSITDSEETSALEAKLGTALKAGRRLLVFDCSAAGQLTSSALRVLLLTSRKLDRTEGRLVLCGMNARLTKAFSISGFDKDVTVVGTRDGALQRVREPALPRAPRKEARKGAARKEALRRETERKEAASAPPAASEPVVPVARVAPVVPVAQAAPIDSRRPASEPPLASVSDAIVDALLETLGVRVARPAKAQSSSRAGGLASAPANGPSGGRATGPASGPAPSDLDALASGLLAALRVRQA